MYERRDPLQGEVEAVPNPRVHSASLLIDRFHFPPTWT